MAVWEGHRPLTSVSTGGITWNNPGNAYDVSSSIPETTTCATGTWPGATQDGFLIFHSFSDTLSQCDSRYDAGIRMIVQSLAATNTDYWGVQYSVDSGANWNTWVASAGRFSAASTWTTSIARTIDVAQFQVKINATRVGGADAAGRVSVWDVYLVGSVLNPATNFKRYLAEAIGVEDAAGRQVGIAREVADNLGLFDVGRYPLAFDDFNRGDGVLDGGNWTARMPITLSTSGNRVMVTNAGSIGENLTEWAGNSFCPDQYAQTVVVSPGDISICARIQPGGVSYYSANYRGAGPGTYLARRILDGAGVDLGSYSIVEGENDVIRLEVTGTTTVAVAVYQNNSCIGVGYDTTSQMTSGRMGLSIWSDYALIDDFEAGNYLSLQYLLSGFSGENFTRAIAESMGLSDAQFQVIAYGRKLTETIGLTDTTRLVKAMIRYLADTEGRTDAIDRDVTFRRFAADNLGVTDEEWRGVTWKRYWSDSLGIADALAAAKGQQRILSEALGIADAANRFFTAKRYQGDALGISDAYSRRQDFARKLAEALGISDQAVRAVVFGRRATEALGLTDTAIALKLLIRTLSEQLGITDQEIEARGFYRIFADTVGRTDAQSRASALARRLTEAFGITDVQARAIAYSRRMTEALGIGDAAGALKLLVRALADQLGITDAETRQVALGRIVAEAVGVTDAQSRASALRRILADVEGISDTSLRRVSFLRTLTEALGIDDRENVLKMICRAIADAVGITDYRDVANAAPQILRTIADTLSIADALTVTKLAVIVRAIADNLGITDARWAAKAVRRILSEQLGIADTKDETKQIKRYLEELVGLTDDQERTALIIRRLTDTAGITDQAVAGLSQYILRIVADNLGLTDSVSRVAALLTWLALTIAVDIPAIRSEVAGEADEITVDSEVLQPAIKTEVE